MLYFAYGYNTNSLAMMKRCPDAVCLGAAQLLSHRFRFAHHADVVRSPHSQVQGLLWDLTNECLLSLDIFEGYPTYYTRKKLLVRQHRRLFRAMVYQMTPGHADLLPGDHYLTALLEGYREHAIDCGQIYQALNECQYIKEDNVYEYELWIKINEYQTAHTRIWANDDYSARMLGEAQYGQGNVLNYTRLPDRPQENTNW